MSKTVKVPLDLLAEVLDTAMSDSLAVESEFCFDTQCHEACEESRTRIDELRRVAGLDEEEA